MKDPIRFFQLLLFLIILDRIRSWSQSRLDFHRLYRNYEKTSAFHGLSSLRLVSSRSWDSLDQHTIHCAVSKANLYGEKTIICREFRIDTQKSFEFLGSFRNLQQLPSYPLPEIAFIGRSNVGKSSLINCLTNLNKKVVITSKTPGRTQGINLIKCCDKEGDICLFADLPGYGFAKVSKAIQQQISEFVNDYLLKRDSLKLCVVLLDARREPLESDYQTLKNLAENGIPFVVILTKTDLVTKPQLAASSQKIRHLYALSDDQPIAFSAVKGDGRRAVWSVIKQAMLEKIDYEDETKSGDDNVDELLDAIDPSLLKF